VKFPSLVFEIWCSQAFGVTALPAVTMTPKANQHIYESKYICDQDWVK